MGDGTTLSIADVTTMMVPYNAPFPATLDMAGGFHAWIRMVLTTLFGTDHPTVLGIKEMNVEIMDR